MANIRLKELVEANIDPKLVARSKETGKFISNHLKIKQRH
jgi:hypothetical protein